MINIAKIKNQPNDSNLLFKKQKGHKERDTEKKVI